MIAKQFWRLRLGRGLFWVGAALLLAPVLPASADHIPMNLDVGGLRTPMPNQGYLHFTEGTEDRTGWIDIRHPAFFNGGAGNPNNILITDPRGIGYDRSDHNVNVQNFIVSVPPDNVMGGGNNFASPQIARDFNYANQAYEQLGISVTNVGIRSVNDNVNYPVNDNALPSAQVNTILNDANRAAAPTVNNFYIRDFASGAVGLGIGPSSVPGLASATGTLVTDGANNDTMPHELGHFLLDANRFNNATNGFHSPAATDLMASGNDERDPTQTRTVPNNTQKLPTGDASGKYVNTAPSQSGQAVAGGFNGGGIGGLDQFNAKVGPAGGPFTTTQSNAIFGPQSDGTSYVQRTDNGPTFGDRADFNFVEDSIPLETLGGRAANHQGFDFLTWTINPGAVPPPLDQAALGHNTGDWGELNLPGFNGAAIRTIDVFSLIARYVDMDTNGGSWSPRDTALDYLPPQFSADGVNFFDGSLVNVFTDGWTNNSQADDYIARWAAPINNAQFVRIQAQPRGIDFDGNSQIDALVASDVFVPSVPEPSALVLLALGTSLLLAKAGRYRVQ